MKKIISAILLMLGLQCDAQNALLKNYVRIEYIGETNKSLDRLIFYFDRNEFLIKDANQKLLGFMTAYISRQCYSKLTKLIIENRKIASPLHKELPNEVYPAQFYMAVYTDGHLTTEYFILGREKEKKILLTILNELKITGCHKYINQYISDFIGDFIAIPKNRT